MWSCFSLSYSSDHLSCHTRPRISFVFTVRYFAEETKGGLNQTHLLEGKMENITKLENPHLLWSQYGVPALTCHPTGHHFTYHPLGHLAHKRRPGQQMFWVWWISVLSKVDQPLRLAMWNHAVPCTYWTIHAKTSYDTWKPHTKLQ